MNASDSQTPPPEHKRPSSASLAAVRAGGTLERVESDSSPAAPATTGSRSRTTGLRFGALIVEEGSEPAGARGRERDVRLDSLQAENERLRRELQDRQLALEESIANGTALSRALMRAQSRNCEIERESQVQLAQAQAEIAMARSLMDGLEHQCADYESRIATMQRQLSQLAAALQQLNARRS